MDVSLKTFSLDMSTFFTKKHNRTHTSTRTHPVPPPYTQNPKLLHQALADIAQHARERAAALCMLVGDLNIGNSRQEGEMVKTTTKDWVRSEFALVSSLISSLIQFGKDEAQILILACVPLPPLPTFSLPPPYRSTLSQVLKLLVYEALSY